MNSPISVALATVATFAVLSGCGSDGAGAADPETGRVTSVALFPTPATVAIGSGLTLRVVARDTEGTSVAAPSVDYHTSDPGVAAVSSSGIVTGLQPGVATIQATVQGVTGTTLLSVIQGTTLAGQTIAPASDTPAGLQATVMIGSAGGAESFTVPVDASGRYIAVVPLSSSPTDSLDLIIDVASGARTYRPLDVRTPNSGAAFAATRPLLVLGGGVPVVKRHESFAGESATLGSCSRAGSRSAGSCAPI